MEEKVGEVFSIAKDNAPVNGCTISKEVQRGDHAITYFSLAGHTDISAEIHPYGMLLIVAEGDLEVFRAFPDEKKLITGESIFIPADKLVGMKTEKGVVYTQISIERNDTMNEVIKAGEVFKLKDLIPYQDGKIVNMDIVNNNSMKFVVMAFDEGTGLSEHAAPGEAIIFALDGEGVIGYEGVDHPIKAGENFHFAKGGLHSVKATKKFKMALLLTLE
ncbi:MAG: cupin domain-containing protein [Lachnospiraceae bacterium]|nr:cupin domain-containing protein [Lachnospiraceae bacterium]